MKLVTLAPRLVRTASLFVAALGIAACIGVPENVEKGPRVSSVELSTPAGSGGGGSLRAETDGQPYVIKVVVGVEPGTDTDEDRKFAPQRVDVTIGSTGGSVPNLGTFVGSTSDDGYSYAFEPSQPLTLPASQKGKSLSVRAVATDSRGLRSNLAAIEVTLE